VHTVHDLLPHRGRAHEQQGDRGPPQGSLAAASTWAAGRRPVETRCRAMKADATGAQVAQTKTTSRSVYFRCVICMVGSRDDFPTGILHRGAAKES